MQNKILGVALFLFFVGATAVAMLLIIGKDSTEARAVVVATEPDAHMVEVLVAVQEVRAGTALDPKAFRLEMRPTVSLSTRSIRTFEDLKGYYARGMIVPGQVLERDYLTSVKPASAISASIPEGYRAVTISTDVRSSVEGWVRPGARVDVTWVHDILGKPGLSVIVQNAGVMSAERQMDNKNQPGAPVPSTVTLLVTADDATKIQLAQGKGALSLWLRGDEDRGKGANVTSITTDDLLLRSRPAMEQHSNNPHVRVRNVDGSMQELELVSGKLVIPAPAAQ